MLRLQKEVAAMGSKIAELLKGPRGFAMERPLDFQVLIFFSCSFFFSFFKKCLYFFCIYFYVVFFYRPTV